MFSTTRLRYIYASCRAGTEFSYPLLVQELRASMNKSILQAERQLESSYVSAKAAAQKKWSNVNAEL